MTFDFLTFVKTKLEKLKGIVQAKSFENNISDS